MKRPSTRGAAPAAFALDRRCFARLTEEELGELTGIDPYDEDGIGGALSKRFHDAFYAGAVEGPPGVEVMVYAFGDSVMVAVREDGPTGDWPWRQLATYSFEARYVIDPNDRTFEEACAAIEALLESASALLPSFEAMRRAERALGPDGRRRPLRAVRQLVRRRR